MNVDAIKVKSAPIRPMGMDNNEIKLLEKQKGLLQEAIQKISEGKEDLKTKQAKIKELQSQIDEIDATIQQKRSEKLNAASQENASDEKQTKKEAASGNAGMSGVTDVLESSGVVQATATYAQVKTMMHVKKELVNRGNILKIEIAFDERTGSPATLKRAELAKLNKQEKNIEKKASETLQKTQDQVASASEKEKSDYSVRENARRESEQQEEQTAGLVDDEKKKRKDKSI